MFWSIGMINVNQVVSKCCWRGLSNEMHSTIESKSPASRLLLFCSCFLFLVPTHVLIDWYGQCQPSSIEMLLNKVKQRNAHHDWIQKPCISPASFLQLLPLPCSHTCFDGFWYGQCQSSIEMLLKKVKQRNAHHDWIQKPCSPASFLQLLPLPCSHTCFDRFWYSQRQSSSIEMLLKKVKQRNAHRDWIQKPCSPASFLQLLPLPCSHTCFDRLVWSCQSSSIQMLLNRRLSNEMHPTI